LFSVITEDGKDQERKINFRLYADMGQQPTAFLVFLSAKMLQHGNH